MKQALVDQFKVNYNTEPLVVRAPGRINIIGEHTDYNNGFVLPCAVDKSIYFAIAKAEGQPLINVRSFNYSDGITFDPASGGILNKHGWANYLKAITDILLEKGIKVPGINCIFGGDIPIGAGMSSSAALCCGFVFGLSELLGLKLEREEIALIAQEAEHRIGLNCGLLDQYAVLFSQENRSMFLDCQDLSFEYCPTDLGAYQFILVNSKIEHQLAVDSEYNKRRESCERVVAAANDPSVQSLRDLSLPQLLELKDKITAIDFQRANYVIKENDRVLQVIDALKKGEIEIVGQLLFEAHNGLSQEYEVSTKDVDALVTIARKSPHIIGARQMGGGFGGCTINLVRKSKLEAIKELILTDYKKATGIQGEIYEVDLVNGVALDTVD